MTVHNVVAAPWSRAAASLDVVQYTGRATSFIVGWARGEKTVLRHFGCG